MKLEPVADRLRPRYPAHRRQSDGLAAWARRVAAVTAASGALALGGCYGASPFETDDPTDPPVEHVDEPPVPLDTLAPIPPLTYSPQPIAGGERAPGFECDAPPEWYAAQAPTYLAGSLCGEGTAWAEFDVTSAESFRVSLSSGEDYVSVTLLDPGGAELAVIDGASPEAVVDLGPGAYRLAATALDPVGNPNAWFSVTIDYAGD